MTELNWIEQQKRRTVREYDLSASLLWKEKMGTAEGGVKGSHNRSTGILQWCKKLYCFHNTLFNKYLMNLLIEKTLVSLTIVSIVWLLQCFLGC